MMSAACLALQLPSCLSFCSLLNKNLVSVFCIRSLVLCTDFIWECISLVFSSALCATTIADMRTVSCATVNTTRMVFRPSVQRRLPKTAQVMTGMFSLAQYAEVVWRVVEGIFISMMHMLIFAQLSANNLLHNMAVLSNPFSINFYKPVVKIISDMLQPPCPIYFPFRMSVFFAAHGCVSCQPSLLGIWAILCKTGIPFKYVVFIKQGNLESTTTTTQALLIMFEWRHRRSFSWLISSKYYIPAEGKGQYACCFP